jgi:hypothetical protein
VFPRFIHVLSDGHVPVRTFGPATVRSPEFSGDQLFIVDILAIPTGELEPGEHPWKEGKKAAYVKGDPENLIDWEQDPHKVV